MQNKGNACRMVRRGMHLVHLWHPCLHQRRRGLRQRQCDLLFPPSAAPLFYNPVYNDTVIANKKVHGLRQSHSQGQALVSASVQFTIYMLLPNQAPLHTQSPQSCTNKRTQLRTNTTKGAPAATRASTTAVTSHSRPVQRRSSITLYTMIRL